VLYAQDSGGDESLPQLPSEWVATIEANFQHGGGEESFQITRQEMYSEAFDAIRVRDTDDNGMLRVKIMQFGVGKEYELTPDFSNMKTLCVERDLGEDPESQFAAGDDHNLRPTASFLAFVQDDSWGPIEKKNEIQWARGVPCVVYTHNATIIVNETLMGQYQADYFYPTNEFEELPTPSRVLLKGFHYDSNKNLVPIQHNYEFVDWHDRVLPIGFNPCRGFDFADDGGVEGCGCVDPTTNVASDSNGHEHSGASAGATVGAAFGGAFAGVLAAILVVALSRVMCGGRKTPILDGAPAGTSMTTMPATSGAEPK